MEMLLNEVICLYYPVAGLNDTIGKYGLSINQGEEIDCLTKIYKDEDYKTRLKKEGRKYALSCDWKNRALDWEKLIEEEEEKLIEEEEDEETGESSNLINEVKKEDFISINDDYYLLEGCDIYGNDIKHLEDKSLEELMEEANKIDDCVCLNNLGYLKNNLNGVIKNDFYIKNKINLYIKKKYIQF